MAAHDRRGAAPQHREDGKNHRLGYLLKHAALHYERLTSARLEPLGIQGGEWAALNCFHAQPDLSQREASELLGIDRTKMVALVDELQAKGWVERRTSPDDRRKNLVELTSIGRDLLQRATTVIDDCEHHFLAVLNESDTKLLKNALDAMIETEP